MCDSCIVCITVRVCVTDSNEHTQLALAGVSGINVKLDREAGRDTTGQPGAAGSDFTGIVSGQNPKLEGTEKFTDIVTTDTNTQVQQLMPTGFRKKRKANVFIIE